MGCLRSCELAEAVDATLTRTGTIYIYLNIFTEFFGYLSLYIYTSFFQYIYMNLHMCMMMMMMMVMMMMMMVVVVVMMMMMTTLMDKFYQPNSGLRGSKSRDEAIYTLYTYL